MSAVEAHLGINQEKFVGRGFPQDRLRWKAGESESGTAGDLSLEAEREWVETSLASEIDQGKQRRRERWRLVEEAGRLLPEEAVCSCCRARIPGKEIAIYRAVDGGNAFFAGIKRCGSVWMCAVCAAKITERRRQELRSGLEMWKAKGGHVYLLTFTVPHHCGNDTRTLCEQLLAAYTKLRNRSVWRNWAKLIGLSGSVRSLEITYGLNGPHVHIHVLLFCMYAEGMHRPTPTDLFTAWQSGCVGVGLPTPNEHGVDVRNGIYAASYVSKWGLDCELTKSHVKQGNGSGRTPWDLLRASSKGEARSGELFREYAHAFKGRRQLCWSRGLRQLLGLEQEKSDRALAEECTENAQLVTIIPEDVWQTILRCKARAEVLAIAEARGAKGLEAFLDALERRVRFLRLERLVRCKKFAPEVSISPIQEAVS
jgi:hypothetical protein